MASAPHVVIIGGGFGGLAAARALGRLPVDVTLVDRQNHHVFQPLLYQVAAAGLSPGDIAAPIRWILRRQRRLRVLLAEAQGIDVDGRLVRLDHGDALRYDFLIVAAGVTNAYFGRPDWQAYAPSLKTLDDALEVRRRVLVAFERAERAADEAARRRLLTFIIVGGGPTGVEMAGAIAEIARQTLADEFRAIRTADSRILLLEGGGTILPAFPEGLRDAARASLARLGVDVREGAHVTGVDEHGVVVGGERLEASTVIWAAGVAASPLGAALGATLDRVGRVMVNPDLSVPGHPEVFVVGDLAHLEVGGRLLPGVAQVAMQQARSAAANIGRRLRGLPTVPFRYRDYGNMATIGRAAAVADFGWLRVAGYPAWLIWLFIHIFSLIGFRNRLTVMVQWAFSYLTYQRSVRLITGRSGHAGEREGAGPAGARAGGQS